MIPTAFILIFSGFFLDCANILFPIQEDTWFKLFNICKDAQILGALTLACHFCSYEMIRTKAVLYMLCVWRVIVLVINATTAPTETNIYLMAALSVILFAWLYRMRLPELESVTPDHNEAYYILLPIRTYKGLFQAVFMPWYPARYETRMVVDGEYVWSIYHGMFARKPIEATNIAELGVKIPIGRRLANHEIWELNSLVGKKSKLGRDCRKFLVV